MLPTTTQLLVIQERDTRIRGLRHDLERLPLEAARAKERQHAADAAAEEARHKVTAQELAIRKIEGDVKTRRDSVARLHVQRFETRKNEEYAAIGAEISGYEEQISGLEDQELELMEAMDPLKSALAAAEATAARVRESVRADLETITRREQEDKSRIAELEADRAGLAAGLDPAAISLYERLCVKKFPAVVPCTAQDTCGGCHMKLTPGNLADARAAKKIVQCDHCARILYSE